MLAHEVVVGIVGMRSGLVRSQGVSVGTGGAEGTVAREEELALWCVWGDAETVGAAQERVEVELVFRGFL